MTSVCLCRPESTKKLGVTFRNVCLEKAGLLSDHVTRESLWEDFLMGNYYQL